MYEPVIYINNVRNILVKDDADWFLPVVSKYGQIFFCWEKEVVMTIGE